MTAGQRQLGVVLGADVLAQRLRALGRNDVVILRENIEHRHANLGQVDAASGELELARDKLVVLVEVLEPLLRRFARVIRPVGEPLFHAQEIQELLFVAHDVEKTDAVLGEAGQRRHHRKHEAHQIAGKIAVGLDQPVDVLRREAPRPEVDEPVVQRRAGVLVGVKVDRRDRERQRFHALRV